MALQELREKDTDALDDMGVPQEQVTDLEGATTETRVITNDNCTTTDRRVARLAIWNQKTQEIRSRSYLVLDRPNRGGDGSISGDRTATYW